MKPEEATLAELIAELADADEQWNLADTAEDQAAADKAAAASRFNFLLALLFEKARAQADRGAA